MVIRISLVLTLKLLEKRVVISPRETREWNINIGGTYRKIFYALMYKESF